MEEELFSEIASVDFLKFSFGNKSYEQQLKDAFKRSGLVCGVTCLVRYVNVCGGVQRLEMAV